MKKSILVSLIASIILMQGCATIIRGTDQMVLIKTEPVSGASCELSNRKGKWHIASTPQSIEIQKSMGDLKVVCRKEGYLQEQLVISSKGKPMFMGGVVGIGVDTATGAGFKYPDEIVVPLKKKS